MREIGELLARVWHYLTLPLERLASAAYEAPLLSLLVGLLVLAAILSHRKGFR